MTTQKEVHDLAKENGFWDKDIFDEIPVKLCLIHAEVSEALEHYRSKDKHKMRNFAEELADIVIRTMDLAEFTCFNLENEIKKKHKKNLKRSYKHGKEF